MPVQKEPMLDVSDAWQQKLQQEIDSYEQELLDNAQDRYHTWEEVFAAEQKLIQEKIRAREATGWRGKRQRFSLAFSGGGIRAAAFQSGVLWQLAEAGLVEVHRGCVRRRLPSELLCQPYHHPRKPSIC
ncbi:unnamed protein product [Effrenium voratum]|nr:unnamed protein product [Effrenium voratum]